MGAASRIPILKEPPSNSPSFAELQKHEVRQVVSGSVFKKLEAVYLGSNSPIEDRFSVGASENLGAAIFSIIDGHRGTECSQYLQRKLNRAISAMIHDNLGIADDLSMLMDMDKVESLGSENDQRPGNEAADAILNSESISKKATSLSTDSLQKILNDAFVKTETDISNSALNDVKLVLSGHSMTDEMKANILRAIQGACALTAVVREDEVAVASTGDCRIVMGHVSDNGKWEAVALSKDQNVHNKREVQRVMEAHPGEENTAIARGRVLGNLMPFRTFGDVDHKWDAKYLQGILTVLPNYKTPPYVTAEPVLSQHKFVKGDRFLILATDGLWERLSNQEAVSIVAGVMDRCRADSAGGGSRCGNAATHLLWHALGGSEANVTRLLNVDPEWSRMYRDDITIMVVFL